MRFETFVAGRYLRSKRKNRFVSLITVISIAGVSVGVIALIVVLSVMTGFDEALRDTFIGNRAHLTVFNNLGTPIRDHERAIADIRALCPEVQGIGPVIEVQGLLVRGQQAQGAYLIGVDVDLEKDVTQLEANLSDRDGRIHGRGDPPGDKEIVLGYRLAQKLHVGVDSELAVLTYRPTNSVTGIRAGRPLYLRVSGISQAQMSDFDELYAYVDLDTARLLTGREGVDGLHMRLESPEQAVAIRDRIEESLGYRGVTWYELNEAFFGALEQEKAAMFIILVFIVLVAAFNITSTLIMIVMEKRRDIGILRTLGASSGSILLLFVIEGLLIGVGGTLFGVVFGTLLAHNITPVAEFLAGLLGVDLFNSTIYYFDHIPVAVRLSDILLISVSAVVLTFLSTLYPAWSASRLNPVDALRYE